MIVNKYKNDKNIFMIIIAIMIYLMLLFMFIMALM